VSIDSARRQANANTPPFNYVRTTTLSATYYYCIPATKFCIVIVIFIGALKSRVLTKEPLTVGTKKISPVEIPTIPKLSMLRDAQNTSIAYQNSR
jgi:hypothetical protein